MKVYIENSDQLYNAMFANRGWVLTDDPDKADLIQFTGGADVNPELYGAAKHETTFCDSRRDVKCVGLLELAKENNTPVAGICRGAQFLHAMAGGFLVQDCDNHALYGGHEAYVVGKGPVLVSSTHHQMMGDDDVGETLMVAKRSTYKMCMEHEVEVEMLEERKDPLYNFDLEAMLYNKLNVGFNGLSFQPHPEYDGFEDCQDAYFEMIEKLLKL